MKEIKVGANEQGQRLDKLLAKVLCEATKGFIYKMLRKKNITLNGKKASGNEILKCNDTVKIFLSDETFEKFAKKVEDEDVEKIVNKINIEIIYEDDNYMIINKPVGELSQKARKDDVSMVEHIIRYMLEAHILTKEQLKTFSPGVCNRLDRNTSGLLIAGKTLIGLQKMTEYIKNRDVDKYYLTIVKGNITKEKLIEGYLIKDEKTNKVLIYGKRDNLPKHIKEEKVNYIKTRYIPIEQLGEYTLIKVELITGRTHQIRAHLSSVGHPIIGDYKYGDKKINDVFKKRYKLDYQLLHAHELKFQKIDNDVLNVSGKQFIAPVNKLFERIYNDLKN